MKNQPRPKLTIDATTVPRRAGIALITVLGMLAMLTVLAVAFAIAMRTERAAGSAAVDALRARQLVYAGLARALNDVESQMATNGTLYLSNACFSSSGDTNAPRPSLLLNGAINAPVLTNIPYALWTAAKNAAGTNQWTNLVRYAHDSSSDTSGRVAYVVVDCSAFLDANKVGGGIRGLGADPREIDISNEVTSVATFTNNRTTHVRYESPAELTALNKSILPNGPSNFVTFSYFPNGWLRGNAAVPRIFIGINSNDIASHKTDIQANQPASFDDAFYDNLLDYVDDTSDVPNNLDSAGTKRVPMLNEMVVASFTEVITNPPPWYMRQYTYIQLETWYPFMTLPLNSNQKYQVRMQSDPDITITNDGAEQGEWTKLPGCTTNPGAAFTPTANSFMVASNLLTWVYKKQLVTTNINELPNKVMVTVTLKPVEVVHADDLKPVDRMPALTAATLTHTLNVQVGGGITYTFLTATNDYSVTDPRINWRTTDWTNSTDRKYVTMGTINSNKNWNVCNLGEEKTLMWAKQAPLESIGELGYLLFNSSQPWHTIRLFGPDPDSNNTWQVFDKFTLTTNTVLKGLVNPNMYPLVSSGPARAVFYNATNSFPGEIPGSRVNADDADTLARRLISKIPPGGFTNVSDICAQLQESDFNFNFPWPSYWSKKVAMQNSIGLFNPRQNLFTIVIAAQVINTTSNQITGNMDATVLAEQRAVAVVWRDPYPTSPPPAHKCFVRYFKWLTD